MKKKTMVFMCAALIAGSGGAYGFGFDALKAAVPGGGGAGSVSKTDIDSFLNLSKKADELQNGAVQALAKMLLNKDDSAAIDRKVAAAKAIQNPQERESALTKVLADTQAEVEKAANDKAAEQKLKNLSSDQKKQAKGAVYNLFLSALGNKSAVDVATGIVKKAQSNPASVLTFAKEMPKIKDGAASLPGKVEKTYTLANKLVKLAQTSKIEVTIPKSASDAAQEIDLK